MVEGEALVIIKVGVVITGRHVRVVIHDGWTLAILIVTPVVAGAFAPAPEIGAQFHAARPIGRPLIPRAHSAWAHGVTGHAHAHTHAHGAHSHPHRAHAIKSTRTHVATRRGTVSTASPKANQGAEENGESRGQKKADPQWVQGELGLAEACLLFPL